MHAPRMPGAATREFLFRGGARDWNFDTRARAARSIAVRTIRGGSGGGEETPVCRVMLILYASPNAIRPNAPKAPDRTENVCALRKIPSRGPWCADTYAKFIEINI